MFELESDLYLVWDIVTWTARRSNHSILNKINPWKEWCWSWNSNTLATSCEELTHWKRPWCWEGLGAGEEGDDRGWDGWMASPTWWTWVWVNSGSWWWTGRPGVLQFMGSQRVGHDWATELNWTELKVFRSTHPIGLETTSSTCGSGLDSRMMLYTSSNVAPCNSLPFHSSTSSPVVCVSNDNLRKKT